MKRAALVGVLLVTALSAAAPAEAKPCYPTYCSHWMRVGSTPVHWQTPRRFSVLETTEARYRGHVLNYWRETTCVAYSSGHGILVKFNGCGPGAQHVRVTATSLRGSPVSVRIVYG